MSKGNVKIEISRRFEGVRFLWSVTIDGEEIDSGYEDTYQEALEAVEMILDICLH